VTDLRLPVRGRKPGFVLSHHENLPELEGALVEFGRTRP